MKTQKTVTNSILIISVLFLFSMGNLYGQSIVNVTPGFGTLNEAIDGDTTAAGERNDLNTIYVLESGGIYLLNGSIENSGYPIHIEAAAGATERPQLIPGVPTGGGSSRPFRPKGDVTLKGLYITGQDELGGLTTRMLRVSRANLKIVIDNCHLDKDGQSSMRLDDDGSKIFITNSIISNIGLPLNPNNGRGIDDRGNDIDTLVMIGNTFYNITSRVLRDDGGFIGYANIRNNTFMNIGQFVMSFGEVIEAKFVNNLLINGAFFGRNTNDVEGNSLASANAQWLQFKPLGFDLDSIGFVQNVDIRNNNFYLDPALVTEYPDSVEVVPVLDSLATLIVETNGTSETNIEEAITFTNGPATETSIVSTIWVDLDNTPNWDNSNEPFDFSYPTAANSYTHSTTGQPLGALNWFDMVVGVDESLSESISNKFSLKNNYPNPFNPTTRISFDIPSDELVELNVFNILGQKVASILNSKLTAGEHSVDFDASLLPSGLYIYQIQAGQFIDSKKMMFLK